MRKRCWNCRYQGETFRAGLAARQHHCQHPDGDLPPKGTGWGTLREVHNVCSNWAAKEDKTISD